MDKEQFSKKYGFYSYDEMMSKSSFFESEDGSRWFITPIAVSWIVWGDILPESPHVLAFASLDQIKICIRELMFKEKNRNCISLSDLIASYTAKMNTAGNPGLYRAYEVNRKLLQILYEVRYSLIK